VSGEKTHKATPKKLRELRKKGASAKSQDLPAAMSLVGIYVLIPTAVGKLVAVMTTQLQMTIALSSSADVGIALNQLGTVLWAAVSAVLPYTIGVMLIVIFSHVAVTRQKPNLALVKPNKERMNPFKALKNLFGPQGLYHAARDFAKIALLGLVAWSGYLAGLEKLNGGAGGMAFLLSTIGHTVNTVVLRILIVMLLLGIVDAWWSRRRFNKQAKMSTQDLKDEHKQTEGDPLVKQAIRSRQQRASRNRMIHAATSADVVLANPTHIAVALKFELGKDYAPVVVAKGAGLIAQKIKAKAAENGVPVMENKPLARALYAACRIGDFIPTELFDAVASVLQKVYAARLNGGTTR
jgi:flagellar biosynthetic protein FlhB